MIDRITEQNRAFAKERLKNEFLSRPVVGTIVGELEKAARVDRLLTERLAWVGISGSKAKGAETNGLSGVISDDDLVILLKGNSDDDPINLEAYDKVLDSINLATKRLIKEHNIIPIYASSIRLEDAQMAIARLSNPEHEGKFKMIHSLIYPSPEAVVAFEPPQLGRNLFSQSLTLFGDGGCAVDVAKKAARQEFVNNRSLTIGGLDGLSDTYRMLRTNRHVLPPLFLAPQCVHVLDYSFKWAMANAIEDKTGQRVSTWGEIVSNLPTDNGGQSVLNIATEIRQLRSLEDSVNLDTVEELYRKAIRIWPQFTEYRIST